MLGSGLPEMKSRRALIGISAFMITGLMLAAIDFWRVKGTVLDRASQSAVPGANILITFVAEGFGSPVPHAWTTKTRCVGSAVTSSDAQGHFEVRGVSWGFGLRHKKVGIEVFKPGWFEGDQLLHDVSTGLVSMPLHVTAHIRPVSEIEASQHRVSRAIADPAGLGIRMGGCDKRGESLVSEALTYAASLAKAPDELRLVRLRCQEQLNRSLLRRGEMIGAQRPLPSSWPDDVAPACEALLREPPR